MYPPDNRTCPKCNQPIPLESKYCPFCGVNIDAPASSYVGPAMPAQPGLPVQPDSAYRPPHRRSDWPVILLAAGSLVIFCCLLGAGAAWWQRERIPLLSGLLDRPTDTSTPRPSSTPQPTRTPRPTATVTFTFEAPSTKAPVVTATLAPGSIGRLCLLPAGPINDGSFNALAWAGVQAAAAQFGAESIYSIPVKYTDQEFVNLISKFIPESCDLIISMGYLTAEAIRQSALEFPQQNFLLLDAVLDPPLNNVWAQDYASDQGAFLAGYLAASVSRTGKVGTFGGYNYPPVVAYMNGFAAGVSLYNANHQANVQVLGWNIYTQTGKFTDDFANPQMGQIVAREFFSQGADILFPVAGPTGYGAAAEATTRSNVYVIGVDNDWAVSNIEYARIMLTSVEKRLDTSIFLATAAIATSSFQGGTHLGTLATEIGLAPFHELDWMVPDAVRAELAQVKADILAGKINTQAASTPPGDTAESAELTLWVPDIVNPQMERWVSQYQQENPQVKVTIEPMPNDQIQNQWYASVAAGTGPDLILAGNTPSFVEWARSGMMRPLDDLLVGKMDNFLGVPLSNLIIDGSIYGIPYQTYSMVLYYNKALLPEPPASMDELASLVKEGKNITLFQGSYFLFAFLSAFDGQLVDDQGRCIADLNGGFAEALQYLQALAGDGAVITSDWSLFSDPFRNGEVAMTVNGPWMLPDYQLILGDNLGLAVIPPGTTPAAPLVGVSAFLVNPNSGHPELAVDLALYLTNPQAQLELDASYIPVRSDVEVPAGDPRAVFMESTAAGFPEVLLTGNYYLPFDNMLLEVLVNGADPATAVRNACEEMNRLNGK